MPRPRTKPYTAIGIRRVPCIRCGGRGYASWNICSDGNRKRVLCAACDIDLNEMVMRWAFGDSRLHDLAAYRADVLRKAA